MSPKCGEMSPTYFFLSSTSKNGQHDYVINITMSPTSLSQFNFDWAFRIQKTLTLRHVHSVSYNTVPVEKHRQLWGKLHCNHYENDTLQWHLPQSVTVMLVTSLCWWLNKGDHFSTLSTKSMLVTFFCILVTFQSVTNITFWHIMM